MSTRNQTRRNIQITREINKTKAFSFITKTEDEAVSQVIEFVVIRYSIRKISKSEKFVAIHSIDATATVRVICEYWQAGKVVTGCVAILKVEQIDYY